MFDIRPWNRRIGCLLAVSAALAGCAPKTDVSATGNVPAQYSHVYMSVQEIWFHASATAGPDDSAWIKFPLDTPVTFDLASSADGSLKSITSGLKVPVGTYAQVRLIPVDASATLLDSAKSLGAVYNSEVDYVDRAGTTHQVPLELQNPDKGIGIRTSVTVKGTVTNVFASSNSNSNSNTGTTGANGMTGDNGMTGTNGTTGTTGTTTDTSTTSTPATSTTTASTTTATFSLAVNVDGARDLVPFTYSDVNAMLLNPHATAYDTSAVGAIQGTLIISGLTGVASASTSSYVNIQVTAESLSTDGNRHVAVNSAPVRSDGTFTLYPLSTSSSTPTSYDLVIHGPGIATIIVKGVPVNVGDPSSTTPVSIGTLSPKAATSFNVNLTTTTPLPAGALVGFYQTLPGTNEVPYLIEEQPIDPFSRAFASDQAVSTGTLDFGTFSSSGSNVSLRNSIPAEGASTYRVSATAPLFTDGVLTTTVSAPPAGSTATTLVPVPTLLVASGATSNTASIAISLTTPKKYDKGEIIVSRDGAIVATASLDTVLAQTTTSTLAIPGIPGGGSLGVFGSGLYYLSVRAWSSTDPTATLNREVYPAALDLRTGTVSSYSLKID